MTHNTFTLGLLAAHPQSAARTLEAFTPTTLAEFLHSLPDTISASVIRELSPALAAATLEQLSHEQIAAIIEYLDIDMAGMILRRFDRDRRQQVFDFLPASNWVGLRMVLRYPEDTVGSVMDPNVLSVHEDMPLANVLKNMRLFKNQLLHAVYVTDRNHAFVGMLDVRELFFANEQQLAGELVRKAQITVTARTNLSSLYDHGIWAGQGELPVLDHNHRFLGVVHRTSVHKAMDHSTRYQKDENGLADTALALSELLWSACAGIFSSPQERQSGIKKDREKGDGK